jgi:hypothetical protein
MPDAASVSVKAVAVNWLRELEKHGGRAEEMEAANDNAPVVSTKKSGGN